MEKQLFSFIVDSRLLCIFFNHNYSFKECYLTNHFPQFQRDANVNSLINILQIMRQLVTILNQYVILHIMILTNLNY